MFPPLSIPSRPTIQLTCSWWLCLPRSAFKLQHQYQYLHHLCICFVCIILTCLHCVRYIQNRILLWWKFLLERFFQHTFQSQCWQVCLQLHLEQRPILLLSREGRHVYLDITSSQTWSCRNLRISQRFDKYQKRISIHICVTHACLLFYPLFRQTALQWANELIQNAIYNRIKPIASLIIPFSPKFESNLRSWIQAPAKSPMRTHNSFVKRLSISLYLIHVYNDMS